MKTSLLHRTGIFLLAVMLLSACGPGLEGATVGVPVTESAPLDDLGHDPCLQGNWDMSNGDVNALMAALAPVPGLTIPSGNLVLEFTGNDFSYGSRDLIMRIDIPDGYMEAEAAFLYTGGFSTTGGMIVLSEIVYSAEAFTWRAVIDGEMEEMPGPNALLFPVPGGGPYECSGDALVIETTGGASGPVDMFFFRQP